MRRPRRLPALGLAAALAAAGCAGTGRTVDPAGQGTEWLRSRYARASRQETGAEALPELGPGAALADYLAYAALRNPGLEAAFAEWRAALERAPQVTALPDPRFTYRYYIREVETRVGPQRQAFGLSQTVPWPGKLALRGEVADERARAARKRYEARKLLLFYRVKDAYYEYYYLARAVAVMRETRALLKYLEGVARVRYKAAAAGHPDVIRAQVELGEIDDRVRTLQDRRGPLVARLNAALNRPVKAPLPWPRSAPLEGVDATDEQMLAWLREANPVLAALDREAAGRRRGIELARQDAYPDLTLGVDYIDTREAIAPGTPDSGRDPVIVGVSVTLPVWGGKIAAGVREAQARYWAALKARAERENALSSDLEMALFGFRDAGRKVDLYGDTLIPKARQSLKATEAAFRAGQVPFTDLIDAERVLLEFELGRERALASHAQRLAELEMLIGRELPRAAPPEGPAEEDDAPGDEPEEPAGPAEEPAPEEPTEEPMEPTEGDA